MKGKRGRGTLREEKPPVLGLLQRGGQVVIQMLENVQQKTIEPLIKGIVQPGSLIYTDDYNIYNRLTEWGYSHKLVATSSWYFSRKITSLFSFL